MTYAIGSLVYGIDLTQPSFSEDRFKAVRDEIFEAVDSELKGFGQAYNGSGDPPEWFGVEINYRVTEFDNIDCEELRQKLEITSELKVAFQSLLEATLTSSKISDNLKEVLKTTEPKMLLLWGSS